MTQFSESYLRLPEFEDVTVKQTRAIWKSCSRENWIPRTMSFIVFLGIPVFFVFFGPADRVSVPLVLLLAYCLADLVELALMRPHIREYLQTKPLH